MPRVSSVGQRIEQVVRSMIVAYKDAGGGSNAAKLAKMSRGAWWGVIREMANLLLDEGLNPDLYVRFVCRESTANVGKFPFPAQVFSLKSLRGWLPSYRKSQSVRPFSYSVTDERRQQHVDINTSRLRTY